MEDRIRSLQATHESQMKQMMVELDKERSKLATIRLSLQGTHLLLEDFVSVLCIFEYLIGVISSISRGAEVERIISAGVELAKR